MGKGQLMANLSIRKLNDVVYERLRIRAANHGNSMEEEVREIICQAVCAPDSISEVFRQYFGDKNGIDLELLAKKPHFPLDLDE